MINLLNLEEEQRNIEVATSHPSDDYGVLNMLEHKVWWTMKFSDPALPCNKDAYVDTIEKLTVREAFNRLGLGLDEHHIGAVLQQCLNEEKTPEEEYKELNGGHSLESIKRDRRTKYTRVSNILSDYSSDAQVLMLRGVIHGHTYEYFFFYDGVCLSYNNLPASPEIKSKASNRMLPDGTVAKGLATINGVNLVITLTQETHDHVRLPYFSIYRAD